MIIEERYSKILEIVKEKTWASFDYLAKTLFVLSSLLVFDEHEIIDKLNVDINIKHAINKTFFLINLLLENYSKINYELLIFYLILTYL